MIGIDLDLLLSVQHERTVTNDSIVSFAGRGLQLPRDDQRTHYVRCPVLVHEFPEGELGVSYQGRLLARYDRTGQFLSAPVPRPAGARKAQQTGTTRALSARPIVAPGAAVRVASNSRAQWVQPPGTTAPRAAAGRPTPTAPHASKPRHSSTRAGAAAHNVDGTTRSPQPPATKGRPNYRAVHNVDSSLCHHRASEVRAQEKKDVKPKTREPKKIRSRTERTS
jgi:hypothetical protein